MSLYMYGVPPNRWTWSASTGYDLSRGAAAPRTITTSRGPTKIDPSRSALVVIDNQNYFLHSAFRAHAPGLAAKDVLIQHAIPASREAGVKIIWVNWGLTLEEISTLPPCHAASFGGVPSTRHGTGGGFGAPLGKVVPGIDAGRRLVRGSWNAELFGELQDIFLEGEKAGTDVWIHKNRMSGMWGPGTLLEAYLRENSIETLFFAGVNADQCVWGTLIDAHNKGFDVVYLKDCSATTSPVACREATEYNADIVGFVATGEAYASGLRA